MEGEVVSEQGRTRAAHTFLYKVQKSPPSDLSPGTQALLLKMLPQSAEFRGPLSDTPSATNLWAAAAIIGHPGTEKNRHR